MVFMMKASEPMVWQPLICQYEITEMVGLNKLVE
jgi:hypothetical protein